MRRRPKQKQKKPGFYVSKVRLETTPHKPVLALYVIKQQSRVLTISKYD